MLVLIIESNKLDYLYLNKLLNEAISFDDITTTWIKDPSKIDLFNELSHHDICFIDQDVDHVSGLDHIRKMTSLGNPTPMVLLTAVDDFDIDKKASEYGACDYLTKVNLTAQLINRVTRFSLAQRENAKMLAKLAYTDGLTGLSNRLQFDQGLSYSLTTLNRTNTYLALLIIDLDNFKSINDIYGHGAGDTVLVEVAKRLKNCVRSSDIVARLGGDEFAVVFTCCTHKEDITCLTNKICGTFQLPIAYEKHNLHCFASIGASVVSPNQNISDISEVIREADNALYQIKREGKNACQFFNPVLREALIKTSNLERSLFQAIDKNELFLKFQPKVSVSDHKVSGVEALIRWRNAADEVISPDVFIPIAEQTKYILPIGRWVIEQSCSQLRYWLDNALNVVPIAINISPLQIEENGFCEHIINTLTKYNIDPQLLEFEITETALVQNLNKISHSLNKLADIGCVWSIDDFGTGYSSLSRLNNLPISKIKIDRSFIQRIQTLPSARKICNAIISLARTLDLTIVVEGIESKKQLKLLTLSDQDELQGYLFAKPLSPDRLIKYLHKTELSADIYAQA